MRTLVLRTTATEVATTELRPAARTRPVPRHSGGKNLSGGMELLPAHGPHKDGLNLAYADGHIRWVNLKNVRMEDWKGVNADWGDISKGGMRVNWKVSLVPLMAVVMLFGAMGLRQFVSATIGIYNVFFDIKIVKKPLVTGFFRHQSFPRDSQYGGAICPVTRSPGHQVAEGVSSQSVRTNNPAGYEFVRIPAGDGVASFEIGIYDVTVAQFRKFVEATAYKTNAEKRGWSRGYDGKDWGIVKSLNWRYGASLNDQEEGNHPVVNISWGDAKTFCDWVGGRLPTHEEWEYAARGGLQRKKYVWSDEWPPPPGSGNFADVTAKRKYPSLNFIEDYDDGYADSSPVGSFKPNGYGLYDMVGNVWQWVDATAVKDPYRYGLHVCCGGSFRNTNVLLQTAFCVTNIGPRDDTGFRVARTLKWISVGSAKTGGGLESSNLKR